MVTEGIWTLSDKHTIEYYLAIRRDEILPFATTWMDLDIIMLSEVSQTEKVQNI